MSLQQAVILLGEEHVAHTLTLDVGCGCKCEGDVNLDYEGSLADIYHDLNKLPLPFKDNEFRKVICHHVLEHLERPEHTLDELIRVGKLVEVFVPHVCGSMAMNTRAHKWTFNLKWFIAYAKSRGVHCEGTCCIDWTRFDPIHAIFPLELRVWLWKSTKKQSPSIVSSGEVRRR